MDSTLRRGRPPSPDAWGRGVTLAVLVHVALIIALAFGVSWRSREPAGVEAELWAAVPQIAAPKIETPPKVEPPPQPKVEPPPPLPPKEAEPPRPNEAEIAIEKARREKLLREQQEEERERREREEAQKRRQVQEQKKKLEQEQAAAEREAQRKLEEQAKREEQRLAKLREDNLKKMLAQAGGSGAPTATGTAARSTGPSAAYAGRIVAKVKPNIVFGDDVAGNPAALVEVRAAPDGTITARRLVKSSGVKSWDDAVLRAIDRTETLPRDTDGRMPSPIEIEFRPKD